MTRPSDPPKVFCSTPDLGRFAGEAGGIWQGGIGLAADPAGFIYFMTGNGPMNAGDGGRDVGDSFVRLHPAGDAPGFTVLKISRSAAISRPPRSPANRDGASAVPGTGPSADLRAHLIDYADPAYDNSGVTRSLMHPGACSPMRRETPVPQDAPASRGHPEQLRLRRPPPF